VDGAAGAKPGVELGGAVPPKEKAVPSAGAAVGTKLLNPPVDGAEGAIGVDEPPKENPAPGIVGASAAAAG